ncbi:MAG: DUF998 domain-containing protein [Chloroflexia bacterium]
MAEKLYRAAISPPTSPVPTPNAWGRAAGTLPPHGEAMGTIPTAHPVSARAALAARLAITSGTLFVLILLSLHLLEPEFDPTWRFISEYALGTFGWLMRLAFLMLAASLIGTGVAVYAHLRSVIGYIGLFGLGLAAIGLTIAAIFITDPITTSQEAATTSGKLHALGASLDYTPVATLLLSIALARNPAWRPLRKWLFLTSGITLAIMAAFFLLLPRDGQFGPGVYLGLCGRAQLISYLGWIAPVGLHVIRLHKRSA